MIIENAHENEIMEKKLKINGVLLIKFKTILRGLSVNNKQTTRGKID